MRHGKTIAAQRKQQRFRNGALVFDDQDSGHARSVRENAPLRPFRGDREAIDQAGLQEKQQGEHRTVGPSAYGW